MADIATCGTCLAPIKATGQRGRPRAYCCDGCKEFGVRLARVETLGAEILAGTPSARRDRVLYAMRRSLKDAGIVIAGGD